MNAAISRLAAARPRQAVVAKQTDTMEPQQPDDAIPQTEEKAPTEGGSPVVSSSSPAEPTDIEKRLSALEALLHDLTGGSTDV
jgi:hypothetical protein